MRNRTGRGIERQEKIPKTRNDLLILLQSGQDPGQKQLYLDLLPLARRLGKRFAFLDSDGIFHDLLADLLESRFAGFHEGSLKAFFTQAFRNRLRDELRRLEAGERAYLRNCPTDIDPDGLWIALVRAEIALAIGRAGLAPEDADMLVTHAASVPYREIAADHGLETSAVGTRIYRAREKLAAALGIERSRRHRGRGSAHAGAQAATWCTGGRGCHHAVA